jgi:anti-anti-sigma factor
MEITTKQLRRSDLVTLKGRIDASTAKDFATTMNDLINAGHYHIILNLKEVTYISSAGLGELIDAQKKCKHLSRGQVVLTEIPERIVEILELAGLKQLFTIYESEVEAVGSF